MFALVLAVLFFLLIIRQGWLGLVVVGFTWLAAGLLNPPLTTSTVWFVAFVLGYITSDNFYAQRYL
jgi:hypothetical protein